MPDPDCRHHAYELREQPRVQSGGEYLIARAECEDCGAKLYAVYELETQKSDMERYDEMQADVDVRDDGGEVHVTVPKGSETHRAVYVLDALDEVDSWND